MCQLCGTSEERKEELGRIKYTIEQMREAEILLNDIMVGRIKPHENIDQWKMLAIHSKNIIRELSQHL